MSKELIVEIIIPKYIRKVVTSNSRKATYYKLGEKIPTKYERGLNILYHYIPYKKDEYLATMEGDLIIKNPNSVGTKKSKVINGQDLHTLRMQPYERSRIIRAIKEQMIPEVEKLDLIRVKPIRILCELWNTVEDIEMTKGSKTSWDLDNFFLFYGKVFQDVLSGSPMLDKKTNKVVTTSKVIIPNDNILYITQAPSPIFIPIEDSEDRKLVFKIYHDQREVIKNSKFY